MTRRTQLTLLLVVTFSVLGVSTSLAQSGGPPMPTPTAAPAPIPRVRLRTAYTAFLRAAPERRHDGDRDVLPRGTEVEVRGVVPDGSERLGGYWYQVEAFPDGHAPATGWLHSTVVYLIPAQLATLGTTEPLAPTAEATPGDPPATVAPAVARPSVATTSPTVEVPLALRVCYDLRANKTCDVDEGIAGVRVYGADAATGQVLLSAVTDATGVAQLVWHVPTDDTRARLILTVPYFAEVRTVTPTQASVDPVLITALAPIPAWLP